MPQLTHRLAQEADIPEIARLMERSITVLQRDFLDPPQIAASRAVMGLDTQLISDQSYFLALSDGRVAGCGGWSYRATLYGGNHSSSLRDARRLRPGEDAARIRAMFTEPDFARRGVGTLILNLCEDAARRAGFDRAELMATLAGEPLYRAYGYSEIERAQAQEFNGAAVPLIKMGKWL